MRLSSVRVEDDRDIVRLRHIGEKVVAETGFAGFAGTRVVTSLLEIGRTLIGEGGTGRVTLLLSLVDGRLDLVIDAVEHGEGRGGATRLGLGLRGVQRMADRFEMRPAQEGTRVIAAFHTKVPPKEQATRVQEIVADLAQLDQGDPAEILARQNRDLLEALQQRDMLMAEMHHRTKNNLSLVMGLMRLARGGASSDETRTALRDLEGRVAAIAKVHDQLQRAAASDSIELISLLRDVADQARSAFGSQDMRVSITVEGEALRVSSSAAVDLALVVGELITNACKHAFTGRCEGNIRVVVEPDTQELRLVVSDDGVGLGCEGDRPERSGSLGWRMVRTIMQKHSGSLHTECHDGLRVVMVFNRDLLMAHVIADEPKVGTQA